MGCSRSVAMAMIVSLFCSQMSDIPEGCSWVVQAIWEGLIRIANGRQVLCLLCVSILETIRRIKALSWRDGTEARWASLAGTMSSVRAQCFLPPLPSSSLLLPCLAADSVVCTGPEVRGHSWRKRRGDRKEPLNLVHSIICSVAVLSHSWEILNTLYDNERAGDRHKYQR